MLVVQSWGTGFKVGAGKGGSQSNALISYAWNDYISHISLRTFLITRGKKLIYSKF